MGIEALVSIRAFETAPYGRVGPIVNEGPVGPNFRLEDTMPLTINRFNLTGEIRFDNPQVEEVDSGSEQVPGSSAIPPVFTEAFTPDAKAKKIWEELKSQPSLTPDMAHRAFLAAAAVGKSPQAFGWPRTDLEYITEVLQETTQEAEPMKAAVPQDAKVHEVLEKQEITARHKEDNSFVALEEEIEVRRKRFVLDERALGVVVAEIRQAVRKASVLAQELGRKITGSLIARFLPGQHTGNESEAVKGKGPDGSIPERAEAIKEHGEFASYEEAEKSSTLVADEIPPIKVRKEGEGKPVKDENVYTVYKDHPVKPNLSEVDISEQLTATKVEVVTEPRIEDLGLAEVFEHKQAA